MGCEGSGEGVVVGWGGRGMDVCGGGRVGGLVLALGYFGIGCWLG